MEDIIREIENALDNKAMKEGIMGTEEIRIVMHIDENIELPVELPHFVNFWWNRNGTETEISASME